MTADSCLAAAGCLDPILGNIEAEKRHFHQENKLLNRWLSCKFLEHLGALCFEEMGADVLWIYQTHTGLQ